VPSPTGRLNNVLYSAVQNIANGTFETCRDVRSLVAIGGKADMGGRPISVAIDPKRGHRGLISVLPTLPLAGRFGDAIV
jgi:hypothetical protein